MINEQLRIVDSLRPYSDLPDSVWHEVRKEIERVGLEGANQSARRQVATAMLKARVAKGDYEGHPFRGNQWADSTGAGGGSTASGQIKESLDKLGNAAKRLVKREPAVKVKDIKEAIKLMQAGKNVELESDADVNTLLEELNIQANQAKERGEKFKINLCNVSVAGSNLFCGQSLADEDGKPLPRIKMPQLSGTAREGSEAAKIANDKGEADAGPAFLKFLEEGGIKVKAEKVNAAKLKASQAELIGAKVAGIMSKKKWDEGTIYISKDNYVIDGHHRWAAAVGADSKDGLGDLKVKVVRVDMNISEVLQVANDFTDEFGIEKVSA